MISCSSLVGDSFPLFSHFRKHVSALPAVYSRVGNGVSFSDAIKEASEEVQHTLDETETVHRILPNIGQSMKVASRTNSPSFCCHVCRGLSERLEYIMRGCYQVGKSLWNEEDVGEDQGCAQERIDRSSEGAAQGCPINAHALKSDRLRISESAQGICIGSSVSRPSSTVPGSVHFIHLLADLHERSFTAFSRCFFAAVSTGCDIPALFHAVGMIKQYETCLWLQTLHS